jgi:hypothetical protein
MAKILLSYDIKESSTSVHSALKKSLIETFGFSDEITSDQGNVYKLPNTTLRKDNTTREQGSKDFLAACAAVGAKWEKYVVVDYAGATFNNQRV